MLHEVVDPDDVGVLDLRQEPPFGDGGRHGVRVAGVEQALEHHPAVADVAVRGQVDPAEPAVGEAAEHLVLAGHQLARLQLGSEREPGAAVRAEPFGRARPPVPAPPDGLLAAAQKRLFSATCGSASTALGRIPVRHRVGSRPAPRPSRPRTDLPLVSLDPLPPEAWRVAVNPEPAGAALEASGTAPGGAGAAASPSTVQYPSSIAPPQLMQVFIAVALLRSAQPAGSGSPHPPRRSGRTAPSIAIREPGRTGRLASDLLWRPAGLPSPCMRRRARAAHRVCQGARPQSARYPGYYWSRTRAPARSGPARIRAW